MSALCSFYVPELGVPEDHSMHLPLVVLTSEWTVTIPGIASVGSDRAILALLPLEMRVVLWLGLFPKAWAGFHSSRIVVVAFHFHCTPSSLIVVVEVWARVLTGYAATRALRTVLRHHRRGGHMQLMR